MKNFSDSVDTGTGGGAGDAGEARNGGMKQSDGRACVVSDPEPRPYWPEMTTAAKTALLRSLMEVADYSAAELAGQIEGANRNMVIGHCFRHKIPLGGGAPAGPDKATLTRDRQSPATRHRNRLAGPNKSLRRFALGENAPVTALTGPRHDVVDGPSFNPKHAPEGARLVSLVDLLPGQCRWPYFQGDDPKLFCGADVNGHREGRKGTGIGGGAGDGSAATNGGIKNAQPYCAVCAAREARRRRANPHMSTMEQKRSTLRAAGL